MMLTPPWGSSLVAYLANFNLPRFQGPSLALAYLDCC